jgi:endonuclease/exonuclease/phosphatase family metal-dependent hydrolase
MEHNARMDRLRVATYNIHKGVQGVGPAQRLEIHNLGLAVEQFDADIVCLQEVRHFHRRHSHRFERWPPEPQAEYLAPPGYHAVYRTNAVTRHGEHGNAVLTRWPVLTHQHEDVSDHRLEQRGLLHVVVMFQDQPVHVIVVHLGLLAGSRRRQVEQLKRFVEREVPSQEPLVVAGDFNDWGASLAPALERAGLCEGAGGATPTFPSRLPLVQLDYIYTRGLQPRNRFTPHGPAWGRFSDHLPLIADFHWPQVAQPELRQEPLDEHQDATPR